MGMVVGICFSSVDLKDWRDEGIMLDLNQTKYLGRMVMRGRLVLRRS